jgi:hypothetical protein
MLPLDEIISDSLSVCKFILCPLEFVEIKSLVFNNSLSVSDNYVSTKSLLYLLGQHFPILKLKPSLGIFL